MAFTKVDDEHLLNQLTDVFRTYGYEGASLTRISAATGLQRASLYHRFPGGKEEMVTAVLERAGKWVSERIFAPLTGPGTPATRIRKMTGQLHAFYAGGRHSCLLDSLSFGNEDNDIRRHVSGAMGAWVDALSKVAREAGISHQKARRRAEDAVSRLQGSLVLARNMKDTGPFERALKDFPAMLLGAKAG